MRYLITGGLGLIGTKLGRDLVIGGHEVIVLDKVQSASNTSASFIEADLSSESHILSAFEKLNSTYSHIDCVVNLAASRPGGFYESSEDYALSTWEQVLATNLTAPLLVARAALPLLEGSDNPSVINVSSIYGVRGHKKHLYSSVRDGGKPVDFNVPVSYAVSKTGLLGLTRHLAIEWGERGIRVNAIAPGGVEDGQPESFIRGYETLTPLGRMGNASDFSGAVEFLSSPGARYVTGAILPVDGGWTL